MDTELFLCAFVALSVLERGTLFPLRACLRVHVHRPPAVTLNETPEEFHISTGLCQKI